MEPSLQPATMPCKAHGFPRVVMALLLWLACLGLPAGAAAQTAAETEVDTAALARALDGIEQGLDQRAMLPAETLSSWSAELDELHRQAQSCVSGAEKRLKAVRSDLEALGEPTTSDSATARQARAALERELQTLEQRTSTCKALALRSEQLSSAVTERRKAHLAKRYLARGPSFFSALGQVLASPGYWGQAVEAFNRHSGLTLLDARRLLIVALIIGLALVVGTWLRARLRRWAQARSPSATFSSRFVHGLVTTSGHYAPHLLVSGGLAGFLHWLIPADTPVPILGVVAYALPVVFGLFALTRLFFHPPPPAEIALNISPDVARSLSRRLQILVWVIFLGYLVLASLFAHGLPTPMQNVARGIFGLAFVVNLIWVIWLLGRMRALKASQALQTVIGAGLILSLGSEWAGYRTLAEATLQALVGTLAAIGAVLLLHRLVEEFFDGLENGRRLWQNKLRGILGIRPGESMAGLSWLQLIVIAALWTGFAFALLRIWGLSQVVLQRLVNFLLEGFTIGSLHITPSRIAVAVVVFGLLLVLSGWLRNRLEHEWLNRTRLERGARESVATVSGYLGIALAVIIALAVAGFQFTNLAIVAGALSVGIGFGLQNIVNNFVSGLILLFERPIRTGDWIVVGATQGYVKRIRIRATQIQTFDRADVIVPNSELIASQVVNWMLHDTIGRVTVPVPVAYGSDTEKVRRILLEIANEHPQVVTDGRVPKPIVLFRQFGESSLDFELRCYIAQVDNMLSVTSELNFAVDAALRREGITVPFPQRDVHLIDAPSARGQRHGDTGPRAQGRRDTDADGDQGSP